ncbi:MAG: hypothetical protein IAF94_17690, partial [Pirellulaceae bacterium]|nr:hypothetical protein [Pirellulaceae bacterium]
MDRLIEKGRFKEAFKHAKTCLRLQNSPENRWLVERAYLLRIEELVRGGLRTSAAEVAGSFLTFGVSDPQILQSLVLILPRLGMFRQAVALGSQLDSPEAQASLSLKVADEAVLRPPDSPPSHSDLRAGGGRIREALAALERTSDGESLDLLKDIPRNSPWADWRYFARGLAAFYRHDDAQAGENWGRLDPGRAASCIAAVLQLTMPLTVNVGSHRPPAPQHAQGGMHQIEVAVFGEPLLTRLEDLQRQLGQNGSPIVDWKKACQALGRLRLGLHRLDPRLAQRLTEILLEPLMTAATNRSYEQARDLVRDFTSASEPLPLDPHWNRLWALLWERPQGDLERAVEHWRKYLIDIEQLAALSPHERHRLQAIVWRHIGELLAEDSRDDSLGFFAAGPDRAATRQRLALAVEALEQSLRLDPRQRPTYEMLLELHQENNQPEALAQAA